MDPLQSLDKTSRNKTRVEGKLLSTYSMSAGIALASLRLDYPTITVSNGSPELSEGTTVNIPFTLEGPEKDVRQAAMALRSASRTDLLGQIEYS